ncbi:MAG: hypothetical protein ACFHXK_05870 [bacterium]
MRSGLILLTALSLATTLPVRGYESQVHQQLTFVAARAFNNCVQDNDRIPRLSALDTRYIVRANVAQADGNFLVRMFRWDYYNRDQQTPKSAMWLVDTRFHNRFDEFVISVESAQERQLQLRNLGRLLTHIQNVSAPAHAVPVYAGRWWRLSFSDRFNRYPVDVEALEEAIGNDCTFLSADDDTFQQILIDTADDTLAAVQDEIEGLPATWQAFWTLADRPDDFGEYGPAGNNFGDRAQFRCGDGQTCLLLHNDPLYSEFALRRHQTAVLATMRAMLRLQKGA